MAGKNHLWPEEIVQEGDSVTLGAIFEKPDGARRRLWYRLPAAYRRALTKSCDPFVLGILFAAMRSPADLHVHGEVSPSLLRNLVEFQNVWSSWLPAKYRRIEISADREREQRRAEGKAAIMGFSGGVDSTYTAWRHRTGHAGRQQRNLAAGVMLHGFDIPLEDTAGFARAAGNAGAMLASIGMELIPITTNFRKTGGAWEDAHGAGLASGLMLLQGGYNTGLIAGSYDYSALHLPWGSNPLTDRMLSSDSFQVVHDGAGVDRVEKAEAFSAWPEALKYLHVCWEGEQSDRNCCRCQKCARTILSFRLLGLGLPECFEHDLAVHEILRLRYNGQSEIKLMQSVIAHAKEASINAPWVRALQASIWLNRIRLSGAWSGPGRTVIRRFYQLFLPPL